MTTKEKIEAINAIAALIRANENMGYNYLGPELLKMLNDKAVQSASYLN